MQNGKVITGQKINATSSKKGMDVAGKKNRQYGQQSPYVGAPYAQPVYGEKVLVTQCMFIMYEELLTQCSLHK